MHNSLTTVLWATLLFVATYTLAATMDPQTMGTLGGGEANVNHNLKVDVVKWVLDKVGNRIMVTGAELSFNSDMPEGTSIYVELIDGTGNVIAHGQKTLMGDLPASNSTVIIFNIEVRPRDVSSIAVTVVGQS
ncbi:MAG: hypothetical protein RMJ15_08310 [Nitrososphaerota archaeon]|nr:hypothetical protein [Candidatus Bathyarchaeota archaeon]MDW8023720.1 hypothetical protein [Nitrososphaerota archaeon]